MKNDFNKLKVALYARTASAKQTETELSIQNQVKQLREYAKKQNEVVYKEYIEPCASGIDKDRPVFKEMIRDAEKKIAPFHKIYVLTVSRFSRDYVLAEYYKRKLREIGIRVVSITQTVVDDPAGEFMKAILALFHEYSLKVNRICSNTAIK